MKEIKTYREYGQTVWKNAVKLNIDPYFKLGWQDVALPIAIGIFIAIILSK